MHSFLAVAGLGLISTALSQSCPPRAHDTARNVTYQGLNRNGIEIFVGIPFGHDTGGENRFRPPKLVQAPTGSTVIAQVEGLACPQAVNATPWNRPNSFSNVTIISEDCLNLNIARPRGTKASDALPVMVFIYGGGFWVGFNNDLRQAPDALILQSVENGLPVMHVNINYRLGIFGFGKSDALQEEGSMNAGVRDQRLALEWLQATIASFGGDPSRVTIFGQSSGGLGVGMQVLAYGGDKPAPFQRAIHHSQALEPGITGNFTTDAWQRVAVYTGCNSTSSEAELACLRALDMQTLYDASDITYLPSSSSTGDLWLPSVDGDFLPAAPSELVRDGRLAKNISTIVGWCEDDLTPFVDRNITTPDDSRAYIASYLPGMTSTNVDAIMALYPSTDFSPNSTANMSSEYYRASRIFRDILMVCMPVNYARAIAKQNSLLAGRNDVYLFDWNQTVMDPAYAAWGFPGVGVFHTSDLEYVYGNISRYNRSALGYPFEPTPGDYALQDRATRSWSTFAALGVPVLEGHDTFRGWEPAFEQAEDEEGNWRVFVAGGPFEGLSAVSGAGAKDVIAGQRLKQRCEFLNSNEIIAQMQY